MARVPQVTRTIQTTVAQVMVVDTKEGTTKTVEVTIPRTYKDDKALLKQVSRLMKSDEVLKPVHIVSSMVQETLYGMSEQKFIENAYILPPRATKEN